MRHAVRESASDSISLPPWTTVALDVGFVAPEHLSQRSSFVPGSRDEGKHDVYASC